MASWTKLDELLAIQHNINAWEDEVVDWAAELLGRLSVAELEMLSRQWKEGPIPWRRQLASALRGNDSQTARAILAEMLVDTALDVAIEAAESLEGSDDLPLPAGMEPALRQLLNRLSDGDRWTIESLLART